MDSKQPKYVPRSKSHDSSSKSSTSKKTPSSIELNFTQRFIDSHVHLDFVLDKMKVKSFENLLHESIGDKMIGCINVCCFKDTFSAQEALSNENLVFSTYGIHPHDASLYDDEIEARILKNMQNPKTVAWGECGLDYFKNNSPNDVQKDVFARQMRQAVKVGKPLVVHSRDAEDDTFQLMTDILPKDYKIHLHCFTGTLPFARKMMDHFPNLKIGFTGAITFKSAEKQRELVAQIPLDRILLETDGPFMAPEPLRGSTAHSGMIPIVANTIAKLHNVTIDQVHLQTSKNANDIYGCFEINPK